MREKLVKNAAGRMVPDHINGQPVVPFKGVGKHMPEGFRHAPRLTSNIDYPADGNKQVASLKEALIKAGTKGWYDPFHPSSFQGRGPGGQYGI